MEIFLSKYINNIDKKGRVSVPSSFRQILDSKNFRGLIVYPSIKHKCLEACGIDRFINLNKLIDALDPYSDERDALEAIILGESVQLTFDNEGRITLTSELTNYAEIEAQVCFVGKGSIFEMWNQTNFLTYLDAAKKIAKNNKDLLKNIRSVSNE